MLTLDFRFQITAWTADMQLETLHESKIIDINKKSGCDKKDKDVSEQMALT